ALIAGGDNAGVAQNSLEVFDPTAGAFTTATGALSSPRESHAGAVLQDGRVLIVGGYCSGSAQVCPNGTGPLASSDIYDPSTGSVSPGPLMSTARRGLSATTQLDGKVFVAGGNDGSVDLASTEVYDPAAGTFAVSKTLATARQGHQAFLLPHNNNILIVGGTSAGVALNSSEQYVPWTGTLNPASFMTSARAGATGSPLSQDGLLLVAGGKDSSTPPNTLQSGELYGFATIKTDKGDYPPGTTVNISGSGWQPGETVALTLVESPLIDTHGPYPVQADANGNISDSSFTTDAHDLNVSFTLTAAGSVSQAQTTFTDAKGNLNSFTVSCSGPVGVGNPSSCTATATGTAGGTVSSWTSSGAGSFSPTSCILSGSGHTSSCAVNYTSSAAGSGTHSITATYNGDNNNYNSATSPAYSLTVYGAATKYIVTSSSSTPTAGAAVTITAQLADANGTSVPTSGKVVTWTSTNGGSFASPTSTTNSGGTVTVSFTTTTVAGTVHRVTATDNTSLTGASANITTVAGAVSASASTVSANPLAVLADNTTTSTITVTLKDQFNNPVSGKTVTLAAGSGSSTISAASGASGANGVVTFTVKDAVGQTVIYTAKDTTDNPNVTLTQTAAVTFYVPTALITSGNSTTFGETKLGTFTVTANGFPAPTFTESGTLPNGVTFNTATGVLSGTPASGTAGAYNNISLGASNGYGASPTQNFTLTVQAPPAAPSTPVLLPTTAGNPEDNVTASITPSFYGTTGATATTVTIYSDSDNVNVQVGSGTASNYSNNAFGVSANSPALGVGPHAITAVATDQFGNTSPASGVLNIQVVKDISPVLIGANNGTANTGNTSASTLAQTGVTAATGGMLFVTIAMDGGTGGVTVSDNATG
ncbi:MAG: hypothetical protein DMG27_23710, partial [Acidobacteria bacterium]